MANIFSNHLCIYSKEWYSRENFGAYHNGTITIYPRGESIPIILGRISICRISMELRSCGGAIFRGNCQSSAQFLALQRVRHFSQRKVWLSPPPPPPLEFSWMGNFPGALTTLTFSVDVDVLRLPVPELPSFRLPNYRTFGRRIPFAKSVLHCGCTLYNCAMTELRRRKLRLVIFN